MERRRSIRTCHGEIVVQTTAARRTGIIVSILVLLLRKWQVQVIIVVDIMAHPRLLPIEGAVEIGGWRLLGHHPAGLSSIFFGDELEVGLYLTFVSDLWAGHSSWSIPNGE